MAKYGIIMVIMIITLPHSFLSLHVTGNKHSINSGLGGQGQTERNFSEKSLLPYTVEIRLSLRCSDSPLDT